MIQFNNSDCICLIRRIGPMRRGNIIQEVPQRAPLATSYSFSPIFFLQYFEIPAF